MLAFLIQICLVHAYEDKSSIYSYEEQKRIKAYLSTVHDSLLHRPRDALSENQHENRKLVLGHLEEYISNGLFPVNITDQRRPVFKDPYGTWCAVGYLLVATSYSDLANRIASDSNFIYINAISSFNDTSLGKWASLFGFEQTELAMIQPSYGSGHTFYVPKEAPRNNNNKKSQAQSGCIDKTKQTDSDKKNLTDSY